MLDEIAKCDVVCANCHRVRSARRMAEEGSPSAGWDLRIKGQVSFESALDPDQLGLWDESA